MKQRPRGEAQNYISLQIRNLLRRLPGRNYRRHQAYRSLGVIHALWPIRLLVGRQFARLALGYEPDLNEDGRHFADGPCPYSCTAAKLHYSIILSARTRTNSGTVRLSALAVRKLMLS